MDTSSGQIDTKQSSDMDTTPSHKLVVCWTDSEERGAGDGDSCGRLVNTDKVLVINMSTLTNYFMIQRLMSTYERLMSTYERLMSTYERLMSTYGRLMSTYERLMSTYERLMSTYERVMSTYERLMST
ncbi:hypothetical protein Bpfe_008746 [Biomphalaria pfeifferi]|uniref:Uncharacterized protein n=1 Tax=Biomphalaria pfeifferi TaxID=112525 RepID=A0AAD8BW84_BIOPF|nr:hypothetical protein Bpfe_008746 [Biomphalaria pfeifferi]